MNAFSIVILSIASIICYIDFFYILKNKMYYFEKGVDGKKVLASKKDALINFIIATSALVMVLVSIFELPVSNNLSNIAFIAFSFFSAYWFVKKISKYKTY